MPKKRKAGAQDAKKNSKRKPKPKHKAKSDTGETPARTVVLQLGERASTLGMRVIETGAGGDCLFCSVAEGLMRHARRVLWGHETARHSTAALQLELRQLACGWMQQVAELFFNKLDLTSYLDRIVAGPVEDDPDGLLQGELAKKADPDRREGETKRRHASSGFA